GHRGEPATGAERQPADDRGRREVERAPGHPPSGWLDQLTHRRRISESDWTGWAERQLRRLCRAWSTARPHASRRRTPGLGASTLECCTYRASARRPAAPTPCRRER